MDAAGSAVGFAAAGARFWSVRRPAGSRPRPSPAHPRPASRAAGSGSGAGAGAGRSRLRPGVDFATGSAFAAGSGAGEVSTRLDGLCGLDGLRRLRLVAHGLLRLLRDRRRRRSLGARDELHAQPEHLDDRVAQHLAHAGRPALLEGIHVVLAHEAQREHVVRQAAGLRGVDDRPRAALGGLHDLEDLGPRVAHLLQGDRAGRGDLRFGLRGLELVGRCLGRPGQQASAIGSRARRARCRSTRCARAAAGATAASPPSTPTRRSRRSTRASAPRSESSLEGTSTRAIMSSRCSRGDVAPVISVRAVLITSAARESSAWPNSAACDAMRSSWSCGMPRMTLAALSEVAATTMRSRSRSSRSSTKRRGSWPVWMTRSTAANTAAASRAPIASTASSSRAPCV